MHQNLFTFDCIMSFAIYEFFALLLALPLSYFFAYLVNKERPRTYKDELEQMFLVHWNGLPEDEYYAWLRVRMFFANTTSNAKKLKYIDNKIKDVSHYKLYSDVYISEEGEVYSSPSREDVQL